MNAKECYKFTTQNRSRSILPESYEQRGRYLKFLWYLYPLKCTSPDVTDILSRMQNICLKSVRLVGEVVTCVVHFISVLDCILFYLSRILRFVVIYPLVVLVVPICMLRLSQTRSDWLIVI